MKRAKETRSISRSEIEFRKEPSRLDGYAAVFNEVEHGELVAPGAFTKTLGESKDIKAFWSHDVSRPLASTKSGTLKLWADDHGLGFRMDLTGGTTWADDALKVCKAGIVDQMSFGFAPVLTETREIDGEQISVLKEVQLFEISPVAEPWYSGTSVSARARRVKERMKRRVKILVDAL